TTLATNASGYLAQMTSPGGATVQATYTSDGLLTAFTRPNGQSSHYAFDAMGSIVSATDPTGATRTLARSGTNDDYTVTLTTALGRTTVYHVEQLPTGDVQLTTTDAAGAQRQVVFGKNGLQVATLPDGSTV